MQNEKVNTRETPKNRSMVNLLVSLIFYVSILFFIIGFNFSDVMVGNWYQQFMPFLNNRPLKDMTFIDSLNGFAVTGDGTVGATNYILRTINSGDNWQIVNTVYRDLSRIIFTDHNTGYVCGGYNVSGGYLIKTTNGGTNWNAVPNSNFANHFDDMHVFGGDTVFLADANGFNGGIFRTTNSGTNWQTLYPGPEDPEKIYMYNSRIGFFSTSFKMFKTTNGGFNWTPITGQDGFLDIYFTDSLVGWKARDTVKKTTDGGINWQTQPVPRGPNIGFGIYTISNINRDTIWGAGGTIQYPNLQTRGLIYRTTNGGSNWFFQIPDTSYNIYAYGQIQFINKNTGWTYTTNRGLHTTNGGDTTFILPIKHINSEVPTKYELQQNYPNPFNPVTNFGFRIAGFGLVTLKIFDITGKETVIITNEELSAGEYKAEWNASGFSSGIYFYSLIVDGKLIDTKKMVLLK